MIAFYYWNWYLQLLGKLSPNKNKNYDLVADDIMSFHRKCTPMPKKSSFKHTDKNKLSWPKNPWLDIVINKLRPHGEPFIYQMKTVTVIKPAEN